MFQVFYYHMLGYSAYKEWYWVIQQVLMILVFSLLLGMLYTGLRKLKWLKKAAWALVTVAGMYLGYMYFSYIQENMTHGEWAADAPYMDICAFLEQNTEPGSIIGMTGGGNAAYLSRTVPSLTWTA